jgi:hypothetical protein
MRLLSFFNDIERSMLAEDPNPEGGIWHHTRMVNVHNGLARMTIGSGPTEQSVKPRGVILLQAFTLADGTFCLKANLSWHGHEETVSKSVYSKPGINWRMAAAEVATIWMNGAPAESITDQDFQESEVLAAEA